jgi:AcrR family transcriptional regulator
MPDIKHFDPDVALERVEALFWRDGAAATSIQTVATATGLNRSSLYATFGGKQELYLAALRRYLRHRAEPALRFLEDDGRGLPTVEDFFNALIMQRCSGNTALEAARHRDQLSAAVSSDAAAEMLTLLVYGVNLRSRAGADAATLRSTVTATLATLGSRD